MSDERLRQLARELVATVNDITENGQSEGVSAEYVVEIALRESGLLAASPALAAPPQESNIHPQKPSRWGNEYPIVKGRCPSCGMSSLFLGSGGYVTCSWLECKAPGAATDILKEAPALAAAPAEAGNPPQEWQPIEDFDGSQCKDGIPYVTYLVATEDGVGEARLTQDDGWWWVNNDPTDSWGSRIYPTHWMPLPAAPPAASKERT